MKKARFFFVGLALMALTLVSCAQVSNSTTVMLSFDASSLARDVTISYDPQNPNGELVSYLVVSLFGDGYSDGVVKEITSEEIYSGASIPILIDYVPYGLKLCATANLYNCEGEWNSYAISDPVTITQDGQSIELTMQSVIWGDAVGTHKKISDCQIWVNGQWFGNETSSCTAEIYFYADRTYRIYETTTSYKYFSFGIWDGDLSALGSPYAVEADCMLHLTELKYNIPSLGYPDPDGVPNQMYSIDFGNARLITKPKTQAIHYTYRVGTDGSGTWQANLTYESASGLTVKTYQTNLLDPYQ